MTYDFELSNNADDGQLLYTVLFNLLFTGIRIMYSVITIFTRIQDLANPPIGLRVGLSFIPELISVLCLVVVGFVTKNVSHIVKEEEAVRLMTRPHASRPPRTGESVVGLKHGSV